METEIDMRCERVKTPPQIHLFFILKNKEYYSIQKEQKMFCVAGWATKHRIHLIIKIILIIIKWASVMLENNSEIALEILSKNTSNIIISYIISKKYKIIFAI